ncbi:ribonuclease E/G [Kiloniella laminariae]|nr:ribonuclease E/G [Kiloniella laminariae]
MAKRMLIDATHPEEVRVVVHNENKLEDFDFETLSRKQLKGNIYLARVTRVEPSLQAAFVEYGGNRHGFLPFSEIHPDYYRIPVADREAMLAEEAEGKDDSEDSSTASDVEDDISTTASGNGALESVAKQQDDTIEEIAGETTVDSINEDESDFEESPKPRINLMKRYKIQEVIKRRQVLLIQVAKEERGNKGAALTTYLSLAGRYSVLMPNTNKGGGISRKISTPNDRKRLKEILNELKIPEGIAVIVRTAGSQRTKMEIRRDYEYLMRLWNEIRETTLKSEAPCLVYEEANLIKRAMRDLYTSDMEEILVEGEDGYKAAKSCMRSLMPSHAKKVKNYKGMQVPLFHRFQVETQIDAMHNPIVQLKSGGYIVINPTEALVAIDVNSGRATKERHIEETAYKTNQEAAAEVARQVRLRDLAGLIVVDFIDMDEQKHNREVERRLKDAMQADRARIQLGRISPFGLLEMSRQRLRPSIVENSTITCPHCNGIGTIRTTESTALHVLRALEEDGIRRGSGQMQLFVPKDVALYILNQKRSRLIEIEQRYNFEVQINADDDIVIPNFRLERVVSNNDGPIAEILPQEAPKSPAHRSGHSSGRETSGRHSRDNRNDNRDNREQRDSQETRDPVENRSDRPERGERGERPEPHERPERSETGGERPEGDKKRRRRRRRRKDRPESVLEGEEPQITAVVGEASETAETADTAPEERPEELDEDGRPRKRRRRGKRGGRRRARRPEDETGHSETGYSDNAQSENPAGDNVAVTTVQETPADVSATETPAAVEPRTAEASTTATEEKPAARRAPRRRKPAAAKKETAVPLESGAGDTVEAKADTTAPTTAPQTETAVTVASATEQGSDTASAPPEADKKPVRAKRAAAPRKKAAATTPRRPKKKAEEASTEGAGTELATAMANEADVKAPAKAKPRARTRAKPAAAKTKASEAKAEVTAAGTTASATNDSKVADKPSPASKSVDGAKTDSPVVAKQGTAAIATEKPVAPKASTARAAATSPQTTPSTEGAADGPRKKGWWSRITGQ